MAKTYLPASKAECLWPNPAGLDPPEKDFLKSLKGELGGEIDVFAADMAAKILGRSI